MGKIRKFMIQKLPKITKARFKSGLDSANFLQKLLLAKVFSDLKVLNSLLRAIIAVGLFYF